MRNKYGHPKRLLALLLLAPLLEGCGLFNSDTFSSDAEWLSRPSRLFIKSVSIETPPLTPTRPITPDDLVSGDGVCAGMAPPAANALTEGAAGAPPVPSTTGTVALGHTECDVVRGIGPPDSVNLSNNERGERLTVVNYSRGQRAGIYTFTSGRLSSIERWPVPEAPPKPVKSRAKKKPAAT